MHCPECNYPRTTVLRTRPDLENKACGRTRICKNPSCQSIFESWESVLRILRKGPGPLSGAAFLAVLNQLPAAERAKVKAALTAE